MAITNLVEKIRKIVLYGFVFYSFFSTSFCQKKIEEIAVFTIKKAIEGSKLKGLHAKSLFSWHVDEISIKDPFVGELEITNIDLKFNLRSLFLLKPSFDEIYAQRLQITQDDQTPVSLSIFSYFYENRPFIVKSLHIDQFKLSIFPEPLSLSFLKKPKKHFLNLYSQNRKIHAYIEIPRHLPFLKVIGHLDGVNAYLGNFKLDLNGCIKNTSFIEYLGEFESPFVAEKQTIKGILEDKNGLFSQGRLFSEHSLSQYELFSDRFVINSEIKSLESLFPNRSVIGSINIKSFGSFQDNTIELSSDNLIFQRKQLAPLSASIELKNNLNHFLANGYLMQNQPQQTEFDLSYQINNSHILDLKLNGEIIQFLGSLKYHTKDDFKLTADACCQDLSFTENLFDNRDIRGKLSLKLDFDQNSKNITLFSALKDLQYDKFKCKTGSINLISKKDFGNIDLDLNKLETPFYDPINLKIKGEKKEIWDLFTSLKSSVNQVQVFSQLDLDPNGFIFKCNDFIGVLNQEIINLKKPFEIVKSKTQLEVSPIEISGPSFKLTGSCHLENLVQSIVIQIENLPLKGFKIPKLDSWISGHLDANIHLDNLNEKTSKVAFHAKNVIPYSSILSLSPMDLSGSVFWHNRQAFYQTHLYLASKDVIHLSGTLRHDLDKPLELSHIFNHTHHEVFAKFDVKDIGHFTDIGSNTMGGKFFISSAIKKETGPFRFFGHMQASDLYAGFPLIGLYTQNGSFDLKLNGSYGDFEIQTFDLLNGQGSAKGTLSFDSLNYSAQVFFDKLFIKFKDLFSTQVHGNCQVMGSFEEISSKGFLKLYDAKYNLMHKDVSFRKNYVIEKDFQDTPKRLKKGFNYRLDFDLKTQDDVRIAGAGLDSFWSGQSLCEIGNQHFGLNGFLNLQKGEYRFNAKRFVIDEGHILLRDNASTIVSKAHLDIPSHQIKINLQGPLTSPSLQLSSLPFLNENSIMSYILFNKPISELNPYQSVELAQTLMDFSGEKLPFSLSQIRHTLSMDSLEITTSDSEKSPLVLKVGKYIRPGVLVALTQGVKSSDMLVQLELKHGFILKAESKEQKDGKFSLKWTKNF